MNLLGFILLLSCLPTALLDFAMPQWKNEPATQIEDAYKWLYQATLGGEHAVPNREMAKKYLETEWLTMGGNPTDEILWQPLCKDGSIGRLNLRPFRAQGGKTEDLLEAFIKSSQNFKGDKTQFIAVWNELGKRLKKKPFGDLTRKTWKNLNHEMRKKDYPAIHHSIVYRQKLFPAYRILTAETMEDLTKNL